jgi:enoyl-CoA hydratase/carnithine racemase
MDLPNYATLKTEMAEPHVLVVTLNRPEVGNAINTQMELKTAYRFEVEAYNHLVETEDRYEGVKAFNEKRKAVFKGR